MKRTAFALLTALVICSAFAADKPKFEKPSFKWDSHFASPGTSLSLVERQRTKTPMGTWITYQPKASGFPTDRPLTLWMSMGDGYLTLEATVDANGIVHVPFFGEEGIGITGPVKGQPLDIALTVPNSEARAQAKVIPFPITARGDGDCSASAEMVAPGGAVFGLTFSGFKPGETVDIVSKYGRRDRDAIHDTQKATEAGEVKAAAMFSQRDRGMATATAKGTNCTVTLQYAVGRDSVDAQ